MYCLVESMPIKFYVNPNSIEQKKNCSSNTTKKPKICFINEKHNVHINNMIHDSRNKIDVEIK